jgi:hypothetical protein
MPFRQHLNGANRERSADMLNASVKIREKFSGAEVPLLMGE